MTAEDAINAATAPNVFATFVNAPRINVPIRIPSTRPMNPLNHSYADFTPPFASTIATTIAKIPTIRETLCPIFVSFSKPNSFLERLDWISSVHRKVVLVELFL